MALEPIELGLIELGLIELGLIELEPIELGLIELELCAKATPKLARDRTQAVVARIRDM